MSEQSPFIFLSYSRREFYFAESLALNLQRQGFNIWFDIQQLEPGIDWKLDIDNGLNNCESVILVASQSSLESPYVELEWKHALERNQPVYVVMFEAVDLPDVLQSGVVVIDCSTDFNAGLAHLVAAMRGETPSMIPISPGRYPAVVTATFNLDLLRTALLVVSFVLVLWVASPRVLFAIVVMLAILHLAYLNIRKDSLEKLRNRDYVPLSLIEQSNLMFLAILVINSLIGLMSKPVIGVAQLLIALIGFGVVQYWQRQLKSNVIRDAIIKEPVHADFVRWTRDHVVPQTHRIAINREHLNPQLKTEIHIAYRAFDPFTVNQNPFLSRIQPPTRVIKYTTQIEVWYEKLQNDSLTNDDLALIRSSYNSIQTAAVASPPDPKRDELIEHYKELLHHVLRDSTFIRVDSGITQNKRYTIFHADAERILAQDIAANLQSVGYEHQPNDADDLDYVIVLLTENLDVTDLQDITRKYGNLIALLLDNGDYFAVAPALKDKQLVDFRRRELGMLQTFFSYLHTQEAMYRSLFGLNVLPVNLRIQLSASDIVLPYQHYRLEPPVNVTIAYPRIGEFKPADLFSKTSIATVFSDATDLPGDGSLDTKHEFDYAVEKK